MNEGRAITNGPDIINETRPVFVCVPQRTTHGQWHFDRKLSVFWLSCCFYCQMCSKNDDLPLSTSDGHLYELQRLTCV